MENNVIAGIGILIALLLFCAAGIIQEQVILHNIRSQLHAPLLHNDGSASGNAIERRVEIAVREARAGYRKCNECEFTNPHRAVACVICSASFPPVRNTKKRNASTIDANSATPRALSSRQKRIRKRKRWIRQVTEEGCVVWRHSEASSDGAARVAYPSYVLQIQRTAEAGLVVASSPAPLDQPQAAAVNQIVVVVPVETAAQVATALGRELLETSVRVVEAHDADPVQAAVFSRTTTPTSRQSLSSSSSPSILQETKDTIVNSQLDFPTKLAEFITSSSTIFLKASNADETTTETTVSRFHVHRATLLVDSIDAIATMTPMQSRAAIRVEFIGEQGIDAGGVYREWFLILNEQIVAPQAGIFTCVDATDQSFYLNPHSRDVLGDQHLAHMLVSGRLLGRALLEGNVTGFHLALPLLKIVLGLPVGFDDLEYFDPDVYKNLKWLLENDGADALCLDFTVVEKLPNGATRVVELVPGGSDIDVNDTNKHDFVDRKFKYLLFESVSSQLFAFLKGLYEVVPAELLMLFDAEELDYVLSGSDEIDVDDWERNTITSRNLVDHPALASFWTSARALSNEDRRRLLQFATGATRVPPGGFSALTSYDGRLCRFSLQGVDPLRTRGYIRSRACFNKLELPLHLDDTDMKFAIAAALSNRSFGFTTA